MEYKTFLFNTLDDFRKKNITIDWQLILHDEELIEELDQAIEGIITSTALLDKVLFEKQVLMVGKLTILRIKLGIAVQQDDSEAFVRYGYQLEEVLRELLVFDNWCQQASLLFDDYEQLSDQEDIPSDAAERFNTVFLAIGIATIVTLDNEDSELEFEAE